MDNDLQLPDRKCDAVKFLAGWQMPGIDRATPRKIAVHLWCEEAIAQRRVHAHPPVGDGPWFVSRRPEESEFFPTDHRRAGQPRYTWEDHPSGCQLGYYVEGANDA